MKKVLKYPLILEDEQHIDMPLGAEILTLQLQRDQPYVWALVDTKNHYRAKTIYTVGTGRPVPEDSFYIGTYQQGLFVWHVFEKITQ